MHPRDEEMPEMIGPDHFRIPRKHRLPLIIAVMSAMIMGILDTTIANVALPHMQSSLGATQDTVMWVLTSYVLASAVTLPATGWLVDRVGIRRVLLFSVITFTIASAMCGMAQNLGQMVAFRVLQGLAGAFVLPIAQTVTLDVSTPEERPRMMTLYIQGVMIGPILGPMLGGYLTDNFDWRWVFYVNVPVGIACTLALMAFMPKTPTRKRPFDVLGWGLVVIAVSSLQLMLDRGTTEDWFESGEIVFYLVLSICAFWMALVHMTTANHPLFPRGLFQDRNFATALFLNLFMGVIMMATMALLPTLLQSIYGYPVIDSGVLLAPRGVGMLISMTLFGRFITSADPRLMLVMGLTLTGLSLMLMSSWSPEMPTWPIIAAGALQGLGLSFSMVPLNLVAFATLAPQFRTDGSGITNLVRNLGSSTGIAVCTVFLGNSIQINHAEMVEHVTRSDLPFNADQLRAYGSASDMALYVLDGMINKQAAMMGYINDFYMLGIGCFLFIPMLLLMKRPQMMGAEAGKAAMADAGH